MLDRTVFVAWTLLIFVSVPLGRTVQRWVAEHLSREAFLYLVLGVVALATLAAMGRVAPSVRRGGGRRALWLLAVSATFLFLTLELRGAPEEALHFIEYGVLGLLAFRTLSHRIRDPLVYVAAVLLCAIVGILDEVLQWITPDRYFGFRDIGLNTLAAFLVTLGIAKGATPARVTGGPTAASLRLTANLASVALVLLALVASSGAVEYGFRHRDPEIGVFYSRLDLEELAEEDRRRGEALGPTLSEFAEADRYAEFLNAYPPSRDPFLHEARVHLFSRDTNLQRALAQTPRSDPYRVRLTTAYRENQILEKYFGRLLRASGRELSAARKRAFDENVLLLDEPFVSRVSADLITRMTKTQIWLSLGLAVILIQAVSRFGRSTEY